MRIITSGKKFIDIDALACTIAYKDYLDIKNIDSIVVMTPPLNQSVSRTIQSWDFSYKQKNPHNIKENYVRYTIMDVSNPEHFDVIVDEKKVYEIFDHHFGYEDYWTKRLGDRAVIQPVGAAATLIFELFKEDNLVHKIPFVTANLLFTAIISNSLNLQAQITKDRDIAAIDALKARTKLPNNWIQKYYSEIETVTMRDAINTVKDDTKHVEIAGENLIIAQIELWDGKTFIKEKLSEINELISSPDTNNTFLTIVSISEGKNYIYTKDNDLKKKLSKKINADFQTNVGVTDKLWLRKEIIRELRK